MKLIILALLLSCSGPTAVDDVYIVMDKSPTDKPKLCVYRVGHPGTDPEIGGETYFGPCDWYEVGEEVE